MQLKLNRIRPNELSFLIIQYIAFMFWGIPEMFQKVFKINILIILFYIAVTHAIKRRKIKANLLIPSIGIIFLSLSSYFGGVQTSCINIALSFFIIPLCSDVISAFTDKQKKKARLFAVILCLCMTIQLLIFRSDDGRPNLGYELNWSAAYLFLFFIYSDYIKFKCGKIFVICASLLLLSRLLILSIILYYVVSIIIRLLPENFRLNWGLFEIITYIAFFLFNAYFLLNVEKGDSYDTSINRVSSVNDGSNMLRFTININVISNLPSDDKFLFGYGQISKGASAHYSNIYTLMPHNELLDGIAEFGYIFVIFSWIFSTYYFSKLFKPYNYPFLIPLLIYTLILWARFLIIPSIEMFFIYYILKSRLHEKYCLSS